MRGRSQDQGGMFSYIHPEKRIPAYHPLRKIRELVREVLKELNHTFGRLYSHEGRPSIPPEQLLSALILQVLYSVRSERQLMEQLDYNLLFRWFVGLSPDDPIWDPTVFTKNRERLQEGDVFQKFMTKLLKHEKVKPLLSDEHFSVDGTLIEAWASHKSFKPKQAKTDDDGSNFHGQLRKNDTHQSTTDPEAKLYRKADGREAKLSYLGHALMENKNGLAVGGMVTQADGTAERRASEAMLKKQAKGSKRITVGEDKAYDTSDHIAALRRINVTPHVAQNDSLTKTGKRRRSAIDARTTRHIATRSRRPVAKWPNASSAGASNTARCAKPNIEASQPSLPTSCSISSPTISCAFPSSSPPEAESARKPGNRFRQTEIQQQRTETAWLPRVFQQTVRDTDRTRPFGQHLWGRLQN